MYIARLQVEFYGAWDSNDDIAILRDTPANLLNLVAGGEERYETQARYWCQRENTLHIHSTGTYMYMYPGIVEIRHNS